MAIFENCEVYYVKCDPKRPNAQLNKKNPTWEIQLRTANVEQKDEWMKGGLYPKLMVGKAGTEDEGVAILTADGKKQWRANIKKNSLRGNGDPAEPVEVVNGARTPIDPNTVGNGSICHIRVWQYEYKGADGTDKQANVLTGVQVVKHVVYNRPPRDEFGTTDTETINPRSDGDDGGKFTDMDDDIPFEQGVQSPAPASGPKAPKAAPVRPANSF